MRYFIKISNGEPIEHPISEENFLKAFPEINVNNLSPHFAVFVKTEQPTVDLYEIADTVSYRLVGNEVHEIWNVRQKTSDEKEVTNKIIEEFVNTRLNHLKSIVQEKIINASSDAAKNAWTIFSNQLDAWTITDYRNPSLPLLPTILSDGTVVNNDSPGSAPSVTG